MRLLDEPPRAAGCAASQLASGAAGVPERARAASGRAMTGRAAGCPVALLERGPRLRVDLGDVHALRADLGADAAARAVVERVVRRRLAACRGSARPAGRRTSGPGNSGVDVRDRAERLADRALDAVVERVRASGRTARARLRSSRLLQDRCSAAAWPVARLMPVARLLAPGLGAGQGGARRRARSRPRGRRRRRPAAARRRRRRRRAPAAARRSSRPRSAARPGRGRRPAAGRARSRAGPSRESSSTRRREPAGGEHEQARPA